MQNVFPNFYWVTLLILTVAPLQEILAAPAPLQSTLQNLVREIRSDSSTEGHKLTLGVPAAGKLKINSVDDDSTEIVLRTEGDQSSAKYQSYVCPYFKESNYVYKTYWPDSSSVEQKEEVNNPPQLSPLKESTGNEHPSVAGNVFNSEFIIQSSRLEQPTIVDTGSKVQLYNIKGSSHIEPSTATVEVTTQASMEKFDGRESIRTTTKSMAHKREEGQRSGQRENSLLVEGGPIFISEQTAEAVATHLVTNVVESSPLTSVDLNETVVVKEQTVNTILDQNVGGLVNHKDDIIEKDEVSEVRVVTVVTTTIAPPTDKVEEGIEGLSGIQTNEKTVGIEREVLTTGEPKDKIVTTNTSNTREEDMEVTNETRNIEKKKPEPEVVKKVVTTTPGPKKKKKSSSDFMSFVRSLFPSSDFDVEDIFHAVTSIFFKF